MIVLKTQGNTTANRAFTKNCTTYPKHITLDNNKY